MRPRRSDRFRQGQQASATTRMVVTQTRVVSRQRSSPNLFDDPSEPAGVRGGSAVLIVGKANLKDSSTLVGRSRQSACCSRSAAPEGRSKVQPAVLAYAGIRRPP